MKDLKISHSFIRDRSPPKKDVASQIKPKPPGLEKDSGGQVDFWFSTLGF